MSADPDNASDAKTVTPSALGIPADWIMCLAHIPAALLTGHSSEEIMALALTIWQTQPAQEALIQDSPKVPAT